jgi:hypothetical protein
MSYSHHEALFPATKQTAISKHTMQQACIVETRKNIIINVHILFWARRIHKLSCLIVASRDGPTANVDHWQQQ